MFIFLQGLQKTSTWIIYQTHIARTSPAVFMQKIQSCKTLVRTQPFRPAGKLRLMPAKSQNGMADELVIMPVGSANNW
jgi:hypothetical protein